MSTRCTLKHCAVTTFLGILFQWPTTLSVRNLFLTSKLNCPNAALCPATGHQREEVNTFPSSVPLKEAVDFDELPPQPFLLRAEQTKWPQLILISLVLKAFHHLGHPPLDTLLIVWCPSYTEASKTATSTWGQAAPAHCRTIKSLQQQAMLCLRHPTTQLALSAARAHCWIIFNLPSIQTSRLS